VSDAGYNLDGSFTRDDSLTLVGADGSTEAVTGSSIRLLGDGGTGIYSEPTPLGLGGGAVQHTVADSEGDVLLLNESTALTSRTWIQLLSQ